MTVRVSPRLHNGSFKIWRRQIFEPSTRSRIQARSEWANFRSTVWCADVHTATLATLATLVCACPKWGDLSRFFCVGWQQKLGFFHWHWWRHPNERSFLKIETFKKVKGMRDMHWHKQQHLGIVTRSKCVEILREVICSALGNWYRIPWESGTENGRFQKKSHSPASPISETDESKDLGDIRVNAWWSSFFQLLELHGR